MLLAFAEKEALPKCVDILAWLVRLTLKYKPFQKQQTLIIYLVKKERFHEQQEYASQVIEPDDRLERANHSLWHSSNVRPGPAAPSAARSHKPEAGTRPPQGAR